MRLTSAQYAALLNKRKKAPTDIYTSNVRGWRTIGEKKYFFKSLWEINFAHTLQLWKNAGAIKDWEYEPRVFPFPRETYKAGPYYYCPDYKVTNKNGSITWYEVKGWMNAASKTKLKRFRKHYPEHTLIIIDSKWFSTARRQGITRLAGWEKLVK